MQQIINKSPSAIWHILNKKVNMEVTAHNRMYVFDCVSAVRVSALSGIKKSMINNITSKRSKRARQNDRPFFACGPC